MSEFDFYVLVTQNEERYIYYKSSNGEKLIENIAKIPFTGESLFEDMLNEFSDYPWQAERTDDCLRDYEYNTDGELIEMCDMYLALGEEEIYRTRFEKIVHVTFCENEVRAEFCMSQMNEYEEQFFKDFLNFIKGYCKERDMALRLWDKATQKVEEF